MPFIAPDYFIYLLTALMLVVMLTDLWCYYIPDTVNIIMFASFVYYIAQYYPDKITLILLLYIAFAALIFIAVYYFDEDKRSVKPIHENMFYLCAILYFALLYRYDSSSEIWNPFFVMLGLFAIGFFLAVIGQMAGGDIKLISLCGLWIGWNILILKNFILIMSLAGLVFILALLVVRFITRKAFKPEEISPLWPQSFFKQKGEGHMVPYGFAIALGFMAIMYNPAWLFSMLSFLNIMPQAFL